MTDMDPEMASLTQSLEELDREVDADNPKSGKKHYKSSRLSLSNHNSSPGLKKTGPGSVPLLASTEDISIVVNSQQKPPKGSPLKKKIVNPESYSTIV